MSLAFTLIAWMHRLRRHRLQGSSLRDRRRYRPEVEKLEEQLPPGAVVAAGISSEPLEGFLPSLGANAGTNAIDLEANNHLLNKRAAFAPTNPSTDASAQPGTWLPGGGLGSSPSPVGVFPATGDNASASAPTGNSPTHSTPTPVTPQAPSIGLPDAGFSADAIYAMLGNPVQRPGRKRPNRKPPRKKPLRKPPRVLAPQPPARYEAPVPPPATPTVTAPAVVEVTSSHLTLHGLANDPPSPGLTNDSTPTFLGSGTPGERFRLLVDGEAHGEGTVRGDGSWELTVTRALGDGEHSVRAVGLRNGTLNGVESNDYSVSIDTTPPRITLQAPEFTTTTFPTLQATVEDSGAYGISGMIEVDVDRNGDGAFDGDGERAVFTGPAGLGEVWLTPASELPEGTYTLRARVRDQAGNEGISPIVPMQVDPNAGFIGDQSLLQLASRWPADETLATTPTEGDEPGERTPTERERLIATEFRNLDFDVEQRVGVSVRVTLTKHLDSMKQDLEAMGMNVVFVAPEQNLVIGYLPPEKIHDLPNLDHFSAVTPIPRPILRVGLATTQGDRLMLADSFRAAHGVDGTGVTVGVISDSVDRVDSNADGIRGIRESQRTGDLPSRGVVVLQDGPVTSSDEGRAMLEIVYDVAPGANLMFATGSFGPQVMALNIRRLEQAGSNLIVDDIGYSNSPFFNDGVLAQAADEVAARGATYFSAAGNDGNAAWSDDWRPVATTVAGIPGIFADINPGPGVDVLQNFRLPMLGPGIPGLLDATFQWDNAFLEGGSPLSRFQVQTDMEVLITTADGSTLLARFNTNNANTDQALESILFFNAVPTRTDFAMAFRLVSGPAPTKLKWIAFTGSGADDPQAEFQGNASAIYGQPAARGAIAVAAVDALLGDRPQSYTSLGGNIPILFDRQGNRLPQPEIRRKPEVAGPDNGNTSFFGVDDPRDPDNLPNFGGTSAAAPHVTAAAALLLQQNSRLSVGDIVLSLQQLARDISPVGRDFLTGQGLVQLWNVGRAGPPPDRLEPNETSDRAANMGLLANKQVVDQMTISTHDNGLPDYDWFQWRTGIPGTVTINLSSTSNSGDLELRVYVIDNGGFLHEVAKDATPGVVSRFVAIRFNPGQTFLVEVKGRNTSPGVIDQAHYELFIDIG